MIIIPKGLGKEEEICEYYKDGFHSGNGMVLCNQTKPEKIQRNFKKNSVVEITKLSNFIPTSTLLVKISSVFKKLQNTFLL